MAKALEHAGDPALLDATEQRLLVDREDARLPHRPHARRPADALEERHFAEELPWPEQGHPEVLAPDLPHHLDRPVLDDVHAVPDVALADDRLAVRVDTASPPTRQPPDRRICRLPENSASDGTQPRGTAGRRVLHDLPENARP
jgi:hypothetical protein